MPPGHLARYSTDQHEAIGVVVIPTSHNVYGNGQPGIIALKSISCITPDEGAMTNELISWGNYKVDHPELTNYQKMVSIGTCENFNDISVQMRVYFPSDSFSTVTNPDGDKLAGYFYNDATKYCAPSPYNVDGFSRNPIYHSTDYGTNALSDFDGYNNTAILLTKATAEDWKTVDQLVNPASDDPADTAGYQPAACACWRYHTTGTEQGDWYLPSIAEIGYVVARYSVIDDSISAINRWNPNSALPIPPEGISSSTEFSAWYENAVCIKNGDVWVNGRANQVRFRSFLKL